VGADLVAAAAALRWVRPDLTAELTNHVLEEASAGGQEDRWLAAAGWAVHARAATGDGRETACAVLAALSRWGGDALERPAAHRLRVELAMVAAGAGEVESARRLLTGVQADRDPELAADLLCAHARCAVEDAPDEVMGALRAAEAAWNAVGGSAGQLGGASVALIKAVVERRGGRPAVAVDHAGTGLARLERGRTGPGTPSAHLAAALAAEWISALLDAGRAEEARDGCSALLPRLSEQARPTRQLALLRLTVTRALAAQDGPADTALLLAQAAEDAAGSGVPDLEAVCRTALGALHEQANRLDAALESLQLAVAAERRDRARSRRFLAALAELTTEPARAEQHRERAVRPSADATGDSDSTTLLPAITRRDRKLKTSRFEEQERTRGGSDERRSGDAGAGGRRNGTSRSDRIIDREPSTEAEPPSDDRSAAWDAVPWNGSTGDSPIGDLLIRSMRAEPPEHPDTGAKRRNGKSHRAPAPGSDDPVAPSGNGRAPGTAPAGGQRDTERSDASSGWIPSVDPDRDADRTGERRARGRSVDRPRPTGSRPGQRDPDESTSAPPRHLEPGGKPDDELPGNTDRTDFQERGGRRISSQWEAMRRRSRQADAPGGVNGFGDRSGHGRHDGSAGPDDRDDPSPARFGRPADDPAAAPTDRWSRRRFTADQDPADEGSGRSPGGRPGDGAALFRATEASTPAPSDAGGDSDGWLQSALAELDRALSGIGLGEAARTEEGPSEVGCTVVVDIARDGRRFAGPRAAAVVRSVADLLADHLPPGVRSRFGDGDSLVVTGPGWSRADATDWMHRTLPGLLDGFVAAEELPGAQLRVAVHDAHGPVGAQILQPVTLPARDREDGRGRHPSAEHTAHASEARGQKYRAAAQAGQPNRGAGGTSGRREVEPAATEQPARDIDPPSWPFSSSAGETDLQAPPTERDEFEPEPRNRAGGPADRRYRDRESGATDGRSSEAGSRGRHDRERSTAAPHDGEPGDRGSRHRAGAQDRVSGEPERPGPAGRRRDRDVPGSDATGAGVTGSETPGTDGPGSRARHGGRESGRNGAGNGGASDAGGGSARSGGDDPETGAPPDGAKGTARREPDRPESTEGLGIADLLAGALAAYRGI
jgi:syndecan 1